MKPSNAFGVYATLDGGRVNRVFSIPNKEAKPNFHRIHCWLGLNESKILAYHYFELLFGEVEGIESMRDSIRMMITPSLKDSVELALQKRWPYGLTRDILLKCITSGKLRVAQGHSLNI